MKVYMVGKTRADLFPPRYDSRYVMPGKAEGSAFEARHRGSVDGFPDNPFEGEALIEFAGRLCYESFSMPNKETATKEGYLANILAQGHESVLEHVSVTFYVEGVSRNLSHELIRHRHLSFSELSQRYVNMDDANVVIPPAYRDAFKTDKIHFSCAGEGRTQAAYENNYNWGLSHGLVGKKAREAARYVLPSSMETKFVVTGNLRAWRDVLKKRDSEHADAEMQLFAKEAPQTVNSFVLDAIGCVVVGVYGSFLP